MSEAAIIKSLRKYKSFLVATHINPDGDALGCQLALAEVLSRMNKKVYLYSHDKSPAMYNFLPHIKKIKIYTNKTKIKFEAALIIDSPSLERVGSISKLISKQQLIYIDHHPGPSYPGAITLRDVKSASCAEIVYELLVKMKQKITKDIATWLYVGIATDTGFFRHPNTTANSLVTAGKLIEKGADAHEISKQINQNNSPGRLQLLSLALKGMHLYYGGKVAVISISSQMFKKTGTKPEDTEEFVNFAKSLKSVKIAVLIRSIGRQKVKVSFRSEKGYDVNVLASEFNGGGHKQASGCTISGSLKHAEIQLLAHLKRFLKK